MVTNSFEAQNSKELAHFNSQNDISSILETGDGNPLNDSISNMPEIGTITKGLGATRLS
eukprot:CAMPEP_0170503458 /NCGR_PEP_ID=MMETSP0208-20121228/44840_1 /TAXON_ID=197538 /ORGANISM="Strombidium inclinatum, Strain S3" /LENGTH=58 /DNA_ID=CAMNT_0010783141 /DNA_START=778 /DNA_END=954 /DNA_ORIENTATION=+